MATWNGSFQVIPAGTDTPTQGDDEIRNTRAAIEERMKNEHTTYSGDPTGGAANLDWLHKPGSAVSFYQNSAPTTRINGQALVNGILWYDTTNKQLKIYSGGSWLPCSGVLSKVILIGDWNMDLTTSVTVAFSDSYTQIQSISLLIRDDAGTTLIPGVGDAYIASFSGTTITLTRIVTGIFDSPNYDATSYNRGWVTINYTP